MKSCSNQRTKCEGFQPDEVDAEFHQLYPDAYARVCEEPDEELCLYTDIEITECGAARAGE